MICWGKAYKNFGRGEGRAINWYLVCEYYVTWGCWEVFFQFLLSVLHLNLYLIYPNLSNIQNHDLPKIKKKGTEWYHMTTVYAFLTSSQNKKIIPYVSITNIRNMCQGIFVSEVFIILYSCFSIY